MMLMTNKFVLAILFKKEGLESLMKDIEGKVTVLCQRTNNFV